MKILALVAAVVMPLALLAACAGPRMGDRPPSAPGHPPMAGPGQKALQVEYPWVRPTPPGVKTTAAYLNIRNNGAPNRLVGASSDVAGMVQIHEVVNEGGMLHMRPVPGGVNLPPDGSVALKPGAVHLMLMGLKRPIGREDAIEIVLRFEHGPPVTVTARAADRMGSMAGGQMEHQMGPGTMAMPAPPSR